MGYELFIDGVKICTYCNKNMALKSLKGIKKTHIKEAYIISIHGWDKTYLKRS